MKKKTLLFGMLFLFGCLLFIPEAKAAIASYTVRRTVGANVYNLKGSTTSSPVWLRLYQATVDGVAADTYCVDPGLKYGGNGTYYLYRYIDPTTNSPLDLAIAGALNEMENIRAEVTGNDSFQLVGTIAMRWIFMQYGGSRSAGTPELNRDYQAFRNNATAVSVNGNTAIIAYARQVYQAAKNAVAAGSYDNAVNQGLIWGPKFSTVEYTETYLTQTSRKVTFIIQTEDEFSTPDKFTEYIDSFTASCSNTSVTCTVNSKTARHEPAGILIDMTVDTTNWNGQDYGITVNPAYCAARDASMQVLLLQKSNSVQRMLVVMPGSCPATPTSTPRRPSRPGYPVPSKPQSGETCTCDTSTGVYTYQKLENGKVVSSESWTEKSPNYQELMEKYKDANNGEGCPGTCTVTPQPEKHVCEIVDNTHYCEDGEPCDEEEYIKDCLCNPVVTIPSDCNDFDTESTTHGYISDIATTDKNCNNSNVVNQIKQCVIDNEDATGESFEATNELKDNPYCKVWCSESYDFDLPTARYSTSGGYFTLTTSIQGQRDCYVSSADDPSKPIDSDKFNKDLEAAQHAVIDAYNNYAKWKSAASKSSEAVTLTCHYSGRSCSAEESGCSSCSSGSRSETGYEKSWTWTEYDYSGNTSSKSESYGPGSTSDGTCSCSIDAEANRDAEHQRAYEDATRTLKEAINKLNTVISKYNSCTGVITNDKHSDLASVDASSTADSSWDNDMQFNPTVDFVYNQDYMKKMSGDFKQTSDRPSEEYMYCSGDTNDKYECLSGATSNSVTTKKNVLTCSANGCSWQQFDISTAKWIRKTKKHDADYQVAERFSTYTQYGTVQIGENPGEPDYLWTTLPEGALPVSLITETGVFPFKFTFGNIGQSNSIADEKGLGRLIDNNDDNSITVTDVLTEYNKLDDAYKCDGGSSSTTDGGYVCHYLVNCPGCDFSCDDDNNCEFEIPDCEGDYCTMVCGDDNDCYFVYDGKNSSYTYRTVSLNNLFPNDRDLGANWKVDNSETVNKAEATLNEIHDLGESVYNSPQYSYTLTPNNMRKIREYNDEVGSYTNSQIPVSLNGSDSAVYCEQETYNGITYTVRCKSRFLDLIEDDKYRGQYAVYDSIVRNDEWTLFTETEYCPNGNCLKNGIGPSWK